MVVLRLCHHHDRTVLVVGVQFLYSAIVECAVSLAELVLHHSLVCSIPVGVRVSVVGIRLSAVSVSTADAHIEHGAQRRIVVDLPLVVEAQLRLVVNVIFGRAHLAVAVETVSRVILVVFHSPHLLCHLPVGESQRVFALEVLLRSSEGSERELVLVVQTLGDVQEVCVA